MVEFHRLIMLGCCKQTRSYLHIIVYYRTGRKEKTYIALECFAKVDGEKQDDVPARIERFGKDGCILWLCGPDALYDNTYQ